MATARYAIDLHMHSTFSDGVLTPAALVAAAGKRRLSTIALTDHDTVDGLADARAEAARIGLRVIAGIELSAWHDREVHILGYFIDPTHPGLLDATARQRTARRRRFEAICDRLDALGCPIDRARALEGVDGNIGRPHIARALVAAGHVRDVEDAFVRFLRAGAAAYVTIDRLSTAQAIECVHAAGGAAVLAHPAVDEMERILPALVQEGLDGIEVRHPAHDARAVQRYRALAERHGLVPTGGSDFHRPEGPVPLGHFGVDAAALAALRARCRV